MKDFIPFIEIALTIIGLYFVYRQYKKSNDVKRAEFVKSLLHQMYDDNEITRIIYSLQYHEFKYSAHFHDNLEEEPKVDKALKFLSYICYLSKERIISVEEFAFFEVEISQSLRNKNLIYYLYNLYHFERKAGAYKSDEEAKQNFTFRYLLDYAEQKKLIDESFYNPSSKEYPKYLVF